MSRYRLTSSVVLFVVMLLALWSGGVPRAGAQTQMIDLTIAKFNCQTDPGQISLAKGNIPADCASGANVTFNVTLTSDGSSLGSCTTNANGICKVSVPNEANVTVTEDTSTGPTGYAPRDNPIQTQAVTEFASAVFVNLPTTLPTTGAGTASTSLSPLGTGALLLGAAALLLAALGVRRRMS